MYNHINNIAKIKKLVLMLANPKKAGGKFEGKLGVQTDPKKNVPLIAHPY